VTFSGEESDVSPSSWSLSQRSLRSLRPRTATSPDEAGDEGSEALRGPSSSLPRGSSISSRAGRC